MRHNALILIISHEKIGHPSGNRESGGLSGKVRFYIMLESRGDPDQVRALARSACRGIRRQICECADEFAVNLISLASRMTKVSMTPYLNNYAFYPLFKYEFHLLFPVPTVIVRNPSNNLTEFHKFFKWLGSERQPNKNPPEPPSERGLHKRRGRPTNLSKNPRLANLPPPSHLDDASYTPTRDFRKMKKPPLSD